MDSSKIKTVKIGGQPFEIPAHMTAASMAEIWKQDSEDLEMFVKAIVENHPHLARDIAHSWANKHDFYLVSKVDRFRELLTYQPEVIKQLRAIDPDAYNEIMASEAGAEIRKAEEERAKRFEEKDREFRAKLNRLSPEDRKMLEKSKGTLDKSVRKLLQQPSIDERAAT
jgi:hypothetical protein